MSKSDVELLVERKEANAKIPRVNNASLPAGSPHAYGNATMGLAIPY